MPIITPLAVIDFILAAKRFKIHFLSEKSKETILYPVLINTIFPLSFSLSFLSLLFINSR